MVNNSGIASWQAMGGFLITSFTLSEPALVEVGSSIITIDWAAVFNFTPTSITATCTGQADQNPSPTGTTSNGSFTPGSPFTSAAHGASVSLGLTAIDSIGAAPSVISSMAFACRIAWGSITSPVAGQGLWNSLVSQHNQLSVNRS